MMKKVFILLFAFIGMSGIQASSIKEFGNDLAQRGSDEIIKFYTKIHQNIDISSFFRLSDYALIAKYIIAASILGGCIATSFYTLKMLKNIFFQKNNNQKSGSHPYAATAFFAINTMVDVILYQMANLIIKTCSDPVEAGKMITRLNLRELVQKLQKS